MVNFVYNHPAHSTYFPFVFNKVIPYGQVYKFKIKINSMGNFYLGIGVVKIILLLIIAGVSTQVKNILAELVKELDLHRGRLFKSLSI